MEKHTLRYTLWTVVGILFLIGFGFAGTVVITNNGMDVGGGNITNVSSPTLSTDVATKGYVDASSPFQNKSFSDNTQYYIDCGGNDGFFLLHTYGNITMNDYKNTIVGINYNITTLSNSGGYEDFKIVILGLTTGLTWSVASGHPPSANLFVGTSYVSGLSYDTAYNISIYGQHSGTSVNYNCGVKNVTMNVLYLD